MYAVGLVQSLLPITIDDQTHSPPDQKRVTASRKPNPKCHGSESEWKDAHPTMRTIQLLET